MGEFSSNLCSSKYLLTYVIGTTWKTTGTGASEYPAFKIGHSSGLVTEDLSKSKTILHE